MNVQMVDFSSPNKYNAGKRLEQPVAWHGPFVMTTDEEIAKTLIEYRRGTFLKKRADWDYKRLSTRPLQAHALTSASESASASTETTGTTAPRGKEDL
jgi:hypothetical protein